MSSNSLRRWSGPAGAVCGLLIGAVVGHAISIDERPQPPRVAVKTAEQSELVPSAWRPWNQPFFSSSAVVLLVDFASGELRIARCKGQRYTTDDCFYDSTDALALSQSPRADWIPTHFLEVPLANLSAPTIEDRVSRIERAKALVGESSPGRTTIDPYAGMGRVLR